MNQENKTGKKCPGCGKAVNFEDNPFRPFCSERCKMADLGSWLKGEYRISSCMFHVELDAEGREQTEQ